MRCCWGGGGGAVYGLSATERPMETIREEKRISAWVRVSISLPDPVTGWIGRYINVRCCGGLSMVVLQQKDLWKLFVKRSEFLPGSGSLYRCLIP